VNQSNQITAARPLQARKRAGTHLALVRDSGPESALPAPYTAEWARCLAKVVGMEPAETWSFVSWVRSFREDFTSPRPDLRVIQ
jgi:hypothetical protein